MRFNEKNKLKTIIAVMAIILIFSASIASIFLTNTAYAQGGFAMPRDSTGQYDESMGKKLAPGSGGGITGLLVEGLSKIFIELPNKLLELIGAVILSFFAFILLISGLLLNLAVKVTILSMSEIVNSLEAIDTVWRTLRDFVNIFFIFILLYIAISTIIGMGSGDLKRLLVRLALAALLINFSLFFTKVIVDASNITAYQFYKEISKTTGNVGDIWKGEDGKSVEMGISGSLMQNLGLSSIYQTDKKTKDASQSLENKSFGADILNKVTTGLEDRWVVILRTLLGSIFLAIAACAFFAAGITLIVRFVIIIILMATSPIAFAGMVVPQLKSMIADKWWGALWKQVILAPAFMLLLWITFMVSGELFGAISKVGVVREASSFGQTTIFTIINFATAIGFLIASLIVANQLGAAGAGRIVNWSKSSGKWAGGVLGRQTLGRAGRVIDKALGKTEIGNRPFLYNIRKATTGALAETKFAGKSYKEADKETKEQKQKLHEYNLTKDLRTAINAPAGAVMPPGKSTQEIIAGMSNKVLEQIDVDDLAKDETLSNMSREQFRHLTERSEWSEADKEKLISARGKLIRTASTPVPPPIPVDPALSPDARNRAVRTNAENVRTRALRERLFRNVNGEDIARNIPASADDYTPELVRQLYQTHLRDMQGLSENIRHRIGEHILAQRAHHPAYGYISKRENRATWGLPPLAERGGERNNREEGEEEEREGEGEEGGGGI